MFIVADYGTLVAAILFWPSLGSTDVFHFRGLPYLPELFFFAVYLEPSVDLDVLQFRKRDISPLGVLSILVQDDKSPKEIHTVISAMYQSQPPMKKCRWIVFSCKGMFSVS
jgi:hypothetical protein